MGHVMDVGLDHVLGIYIPPLAHGGNVSLFASFVVFLPVLVAWHCVFHAPASFDASGKSISLPGSCLLLAARHYFVYFDKPRWSVIEFKRVAT